MRRPKLKANYPRNEVQREDESRLTGTKPEEQVELSDPGESGLETICIMPPYDHAP